MEVTSELRGEYYRASKWVDRYGWVWTWHPETERWRGAGYGGVTAAATEHEISSYLLLGGRGPFIRLADGPQPIPKAAIEFTIAFDHPMDEITAGGFGLWLNMVLQSSAQDDPESDHGPYTISYREPR